MGYDESGYQPLTLVHTHLLWHFETEFSVLRIPEIGAKKSLEDRQTEQSQELRSISRSPGLKYWGQAF